MEIGQTSKPRFEFRTFGQGFSHNILKMSSLSEPVPEKFRKRISGEIYLISAANNTNNVKIRDGKLDIKTFVQEKEALEQWEPLTKAEFPLTAEFLGENLFAALGVDIPDFDQEKYSLKALLKIAQMHPDLTAVRVKKQRFGYMVNNTICEHANVLINGALVVSLSSESTEIDDIKKTIRDVGLVGIENINYLKAIKRVTGYDQGRLVNEVFE